MKTPEKIYVSEICDFECGSEQCSKYKCGDDIEYVRKDVAESEREAFAIFCYDAGRWVTAMQMKENASS